MLEWENVLPDVISSLGADAESGPCVLDFLRILPEEVTEGRKITLSVRQAEYVESTDECRTDQPLRKMISVRGLSNCWRIMHPKSCSS